MLFVAICALMSLSVSSMADWVMTQTTPVITSTTGTGTFTVGSGYLKGVGHDENDSYATATYSVVYAWQSGLWIGTSGGITCDLKGSCSASGQTAGAQAFENGNIIWQDYADYDEGRPSFQSYRDITYYVPWPYKYILVTLKVYVKGDGATATSATTAWIAP
jgi:hypothetical protein